MVGYLWQTTTKYSHCHALIAPHEVGRSFSGEHGVFAGKGFYQDLAMASNQTRHIPTDIVAFIGSRQRSSSQLVREKMTLQLYQQQQQEEDPFRNKPSSPTISTCYLDDIR